MKIKTVPRSPPTDRLGAVLLVLGVPYAVALGLFSVIGLVGGAMMPVYGALVARLFGTMAFDESVRFLTEGLKLSNDTVSHIPLHNQIIPWAMKKNIDVVHRADNRIDWRLVKVN